MLLYYFFIVDFYLDQIFFPYTFLESEIIINDKSVVYTSGSGGLFKAGIPVGIYHKEIDENYEIVQFFSKLSQLTFVKLVSFEKGEN